MKNNIYKNRQNFISNGNNIRIKNEKLRNILSWLLIGILCFTIIGSVLGTIAFGKTHTASADSVSSTTTHTFSGNNFFVPTSSTNTYNIYDYTYKVYFLSVDVAFDKIYTYLKNSQWGNHEFRVDCVIPSFRIYLDNRYKCMSYMTNNRGDTEGKFVLGSSNNELTSFFTLPNSGFSDAQGNTIERMSDLTPKSQLHYSVKLFYSDGSSTGYVGTYGVMYCSIEVGFNADVVSISYYNESYPIVNDYSHAVLNSIQYRDRNGYTADITFRGVYLDSIYKTGMISWEPRTYYLENAFNDNTLYEQGFKTGYNDGKNDGVVQYKDSSQFKEDAHSKFYNNFIEEYKESSSFKTLIEQAKESGRMEERAEGSNVTFTNTLSAMYNAPLVAFRDFLNFDLLGVNMLGFFTGLFTIAFVLFVIKKLT